MTKQPLTRINYNIPMGLYERENGVLRRVSGETRISGGAGRRASPAI